MPDTCCTLHLTGATNAPRAIVFHCSGIIGRDTCLLPFVQAQFEFHCVSRKRHVHVFSSFLDLSQARFYLFTHISTTQISPAAITFYNSRQWLTFVSDTESRGHLKIGNEIKKIKIHIFCNQPKAISSKKIKWKFGHFCWFKTFQLSILLSKRIGTGKGLSEEIDTQPAIYSQSILRDKSLSNFLLISVNFPICLSLKLGGEEAESSTGAHHFSAAVACV